ncbi:MAG: NAD(+)/NADH kinase [Planctomycetes bacterium]|nr:NAD(+)/NADH kinase [Planctomycetota bacterium]
MSDDKVKRRVYLLANPDKPEAARAMRAAENFQVEGVEIVGSAVGLDATDAVKAGVDRLIVFGGDGTLIGVARSLGANQLPLVGVNIGKLGFLAEFSPDELKESFERVIRDDTLVTRRIALHVTVRHNGGVRDTSLAINDCVIHAGPPYRIIRLGVSINGEHLTTVGGDGLIVCTPSGSTAHNLSAGGPIVQPSVPAIVLSPMNPHSLTHKPLVVESDSTIEIHASEVNEGSTAIIDGQVTFPLQPGDRITVRRFESDYLLVRNPLYARWHKLVTKLHWGRSPSYD